MSREMSRRQKVILKFSSLLPITSDNFKGACRNGFHLLFAWLLYPHPFSMENRW